MKTLLIITSLFLLSCGKSELHPVIETESVDTLQKVFTKTEYFTDSLVSVYYHSPNKTVNIKSKGVYAVLDTLVIGDKIIAYAGDIKRKTGRLEFSISDGISVKTNCSAKDYTFVSGIKIVGQ